MLKELLDGLMENRKPEFQSRMLDDGKLCDFAIVPESMDIKSLKGIKDEYKTKPDRRKGMINALDLISFVNLANRFKADNSALFQKATIGDQRFDADLRCVLNYHPAGGDNKSADNKDHTVHYGFPLSEELKTWLAKNKQPFNSKEFAEFLEDNIADLVVADPARFVTNFGDITPSFTTPSMIMQLSRGIDIRVDEKVTQAYRVSDGSFNLQYTSDNKDSTGQPLRLPEWFALGIPVFQNGESYQIPLRLRFRVKEGQVSWFFEMYRKNDVFNAAFNKDCSVAQVKTEIPMFNGVPE